MPLVAGAEGRAAGVVARALGVAAGTVALGVAPVLAGELELVFDMFVTVPFVGGGVVAVVAPAAGAGRAPLNSFGLSTTFFAR